MLVVDETKVEKSNVQIRSMKITLSAQFLGGPNKQLRYQDFSIRNTTNEPIIINLIAL